jgi:ribose 5-phosphate isomerase B
MRMAAGSDCMSRLTAEITGYPESKGHEVERCGAIAGREADYVDAASEVARAVAAGRGEQGLIFRNTGAGVTIIANKFFGVRAALCADTFSARIARLANNANVLGLGMRLTGEPHARGVVDSWLETAPSTEPWRMSFHRKTDELDRKLRKAPQGDEPA